MPELARAAMVDFAADYAGSINIGRGRALEPIKLGADQRSFAFALDNDLIKLVTLTPGAGSLAVRVRYATDVVIEDDRYTLAMARQPEISADAFGVVVRWEAELMPKLRWPLITHSRRF